MRWTGCEKWSSKRRVKIIVKREADQKEWTDRRVTKIGITWDSRRSTFLGCISPEGPVPGLLISPYVNFSKNFAQYTYLSMQAFKSTKSGFISLEHFMFWLQQERNHDKVWKIPGSNPWIIYKSTSPQSWNSAFQDAGISFYYDTERNDFFCQVDPRLARRVNKAHEQFCDSYVMQQLIQKVRLLEFEKRIKSNNMMVPKFSTSVLFMAGP